MRAFTDFRGRARQMARVMGVEELEIQGIAVTNPRIEQMLLRQGFTRQTVGFQRPLVATEEWRSSRKSFV